MQLIHLFAIHIQCRVKPKPSISTILDDSDTNHCTSDPNIVNFSTPHFSCKILSNFLLNSESSCKNKSPNKNKSTLRIRIIVAKFDLQNLVYC